MEVNYILIKGDKHFKCYNLAEMAFYFSLYSQQWNRNL
jgi:hypothetical protein